MSTVNCDLNLLLTRDVVQLQQVALVEALATAPPSIADVIGESPALVADSAPILLTTAAELSEKPEGAACNRERR